MCTGEAARDERFAAHTSPVARNSVSLPNDDQDADLIRALVRRIRIHPGNLNRTKLIRDDIDYIWAQRRGAKQGHRKRSDDAWWSPEALDLKDVRGRTVGEHLVPMKVVVGRMLELDAMGQLDRRATLELLRLPMAVITDKQDGRLVAAGLKQKLTGVVTWTIETDLDCIVWDRHVAVGFNVSTYRRFNQTGLGDSGPL